MTDLERLCAVLEGVGDRLLAIENELKRTTQIMAKQAAAKETIATFAIALFHNALKISGVIQ